MISRTQLWLRRNRQENTREARYSMELAFDKELKELDRELELRFNMQGGHWTVYYEHNGILSVLKTVDASRGWLCNTFRQIYQWLKHDGAMTKRELIKQHLKQRELEEELDRKKRHEVVEELALETHRCAKERVVTDGITTKRHLA